MKDRILLLALLERGMGPRLSSLAWVGRVTYSSYLIHFPLQILFVLTLGWVASPLDPRSGLTVLAYFAVLLPLSLLTYSGFERPLQDWLRSKSRRPDRTRDNRQAILMPKLGEPLVAGKATAK